MVNILNSTNSIANSFLYEMRSKDIQNDRARFRNNLKRLGMVMAFEISKQLDYQDKNVQTPLGTSKVSLISNQPIVIAIMRASLPFYDGFIEFYDNADSGFIGAYRKGHTGDVEISLDYIATPKLEDRDLIIADPMLATGKSLIKTIEYLLIKGRPKHIHIAAAVAAPQGIDYISQSLSIDHTIWAGAVDDGLDDNAFIIPGLGDAGDLCFGPKV